MSAADPLTGTSVTTSSSAAWLHVRRGVGSEETRSVLLCSRDRGLLGCLLRLSRLFDLLGITGGSTAKSNELSRDLVFLIFATQSFDLET